MTVKTLIRELLDYQPDAEVNVIVSDEDGNIKVGGPVITYSARLGRDKFDTVFISGKEMTL